MQPGSRQSPVSSVKLGAISMRGDGCSGQWQFQTLVSRKPLTLAITASAVPKGAIAVNDVVLIGPNATVIGSRGQRRKRSARPSAEALLHVTVARVRHAGRFCIHIRAAAGERRAPLEIASSVSST